MITLAVPVASLAVSCLMLYVNEIHHTDVNALWYMARHGSGFGFLIFICRRDSLSSQLPLHPVSSAVVASSKPSYLCHGA